MHPNHTHFLNFQIKGHEPKTVSCTEDYFNEKMLFWVKNPSYQEKLNEIIDAREQVGMVFTMANFAGEGGLIPKKKKPTPPEIAPPPRSPEEQAKIAKKAKEIGDKYLGKDRKERAEKYKKEQEILRQNNLQASIGIDRERNLGFSKFSSPN